MSGIIMEKATKIRI